MGMEECVQYIEAVVIIGVLLYCGAVVLDKLSAAGMVNSTGAFNGTVAQVANIWTNATGMIATVTIIGAAAIIIKMVMNFRSSNQ